MFSRSIASYSYERVLQRWGMPAVRLGAGVGALDYLVDYSKRPDSFFSNVLGAAFYTGAGAVIGGALVFAHPLVVAGIAVGAPAYVVQRLRN